MPSRLVAAALFASTAIASLAVKVPRADGEVVDSEKLQASITQDLLKTRAEKLFEIAEVSTEELGHPTRAIGTSGELNQYTILASDSPY